MHKKVLWDRVHRLEMDIEALMKMDDFVSNKMNGVLDQPCDEEFDPNMVPEHPDEDQETVKLKSSSGGHSKSITTLHPPPSKRGVSKKKPNCKFRSAEASPTQCLEASDHLQSHSVPLTLPSAAQRRRACVGVRKRMPHHPKYMRPAPSTRREKASCKAAHDYPAPEAYKSEANTPSSRSQQVDYTDVSEEVEFVAVDEYSEQNFFPEEECKQESYPQHGGYSGGGSGALEAKYEATLERLTSERRRRAIAEKTLRVLRERLEQNQSALRDANRARNAALSVATQLRDKYETLRVARHQALEHLQTLKAENMALSEQLSAEAARRRTLASRLESAEVEGGAAAAAGGREVARLRELLEEGRRGREALRAEAAAEAARAAEMRRRLRDAEEAADAARRRREEMEEALAQERRRRRSLDDPEVQPMLEQATRELRDRLAMEARLRNEAQETCRVQQCRLQAEAEAKGAAVAAAAAAAAAASEAAAAAAREREREEAAAERQQLQAGAGGGGGGAGVVGVSELREVLAKEAFRHAEELQRRADEARQLLLRCDALERQLKAQQADEDRRFVAAEEQWQRTRASMKDKEQLMQREHQELERLTVELTVALRTQRQQMRELQQAHQRQEGLLLAQQHAMQSKDEQLRLAHSETQTLRERTQQMQEQIDSLAQQTQQGHKCGSGGGRAEEEVGRRRSETLSGTAEATASSSSTRSANTANEQLGSRTNTSKSNSSPLAPVQSAVSSSVPACASAGALSSAAQAPLQVHQMHQVQVAAAGDRRCERCESTRRLAKLAEAELKKFKTALETAQDNLRIKDKVIEDQGDSIRRLKEHRRDDQAASSRERHKLQAALAQERRLAQKLRQELSLSRRRCQQLEERCERLAEEVAGSGAEEQQRLLEQLEDEVREQRTLWERQMQKLSGEKEQALQAAELSAKRLQETMEEFQHQVASHRKVQSMLTAHLTRKEKELAEAHATVRLLNCPDGHSHSYGCWPASAPIAPQQAQAQAQPAEQHPPPPQPSPPSATLQKLPAPQPPPPQTTTATNTNTTHNKSVDDMPITTQDHQEHKAPPHGHPHMASSASAPPGMLLPSPPPAPPPPSKPLPLGKPLPQHLPLPLAQPLHDGPSLQGARLGPSAQQQAPVSSTPSFSHFMYPHLMFSSYTPRPPSVNFF